MTPTARTFDAGFALLDRQLVDHDDRLVGKVDDIEFTVPSDGTNPVVAALLTGPGALAPRLGHPLITSIAKLHLRLAQLSEPQQIPFAQVTDIGEHITVSCRRDDLGSQTGERWARNNIVARIVGGDYECE